MVKTASTMLPLGTKAPSFKLMNIDGHLVSSTDFQGKQGLVVIFMCNHCPYVKHVASELSRVAREYMPKGIGFVGISSNDTDAYPEDGLEKMAEEAATQGYPFPYLLDADQSVAMAYHAACTPDFYLFDAEQHLVYRGQLDDSRPKTDRPLNGKDLRAAIECVLTGQPVPAEQRPSIGCNIKWKPGAEPTYFNPAGVSG